MELELNEEFITENGLSTEQVEAIKTTANTYYGDKIAGLKQEWDGKANADAEGILNGAADAIAKETGVKRESGQKIADYIGAAWTGFSSIKTAEVDALKSKYDTMLKDFKGDEATASELADAKERLDQAQQKLANYDELTEKAALVDGLTSENNALTKRVTFGNIKPNFPETVNTYEAKAVWEEFVSETEEEWDVKLVDKIPTAINKENPHKTAKLSDLLDKNEAIAKLMAGRAQEGSGASPADLHKIEGVPFDVPKDADSATRATLIKDYLAKKGVSNMSSEYSKQFAELNNKMLQKTAS